MSLKIISKFTVLNRQCIADFNWYSGISIVESTDTEYEL
jgi:hypothetical protein